MITVFIVALLAAIAMPAFIKARAEAQKTAIATACARNLAILDAAKGSAAAERGRRAGEVVTEEEVAAYLKTGVTGLVCRTGGQYTIHPVGQPPECSAHGSLEIEGGAPAGGRGR